MKHCEIAIEGIVAARAMEKLVQGGVPVLGARLQKNGVAVRVDGKHRKKVFAILRGSCYNGKEVRFSGLLAALRCLRRHAGLAAGGALCCALVLFFQSRVLRIEVTGSGAYYRAEVMRALSEADVGFCSPPPADRAALTGYFLSLPRVGFCSLSHAGGVLTVHLEVREEASPADKGPLTAPADGTLEQLVVLSGRACAAVGEEVRAGQTLVTGGEGSVVALAAVRTAVDRVYAGGEEYARAQAYLDFGTLGQITIQKTGEGWRITGEALVRASCNFG